tara:strand:+ start:10212 stop:11099 length:888 start_codon:yes stop_codon:yes gene_type:complete
MQNAESDSLGRATFHHIPPRDDVRPTAREARWFQFIARHGPQSSQTLFELTQDTHRCKDTALRSLQRLRAAGCLRLPVQQRATERAEFHPYIYDLTERGKRHLVDQGCDHWPFRPTGHWWHAYRVGQVTASIDMAAARFGVRYIPAHEILARKGTDIAIPLGTSKLIPDQLFALDYGGRYRAFVLEVDRGTEPKSSPANRKSWARSLDQYDRALDKGLFHTRYGLKARVLVLWVVNTRSDQLTLLEMIAARGAKLGQSVLVSRVSLQETAPYRPEPRWFTGSWLRVGGEVVSIAN